MGTAGKFFQSLSEKAHEKAELGRAEQEKSRKAEIDVWGKVLQDPYASQEQRQKAVENLNKLYQIKKGDSPFARLGQFMSHVGGKLQGKQPNAQTAQPGQPPAPGMAPAGEQPGQGPNGAAPAPKDTPAQLQPLDAKADPNPGKANIASKMLGKVASGLGGGIQHVSDAINPQPKPFPQLDASAFPSAEQARAGKAADTKADLEAKEPFIEKQIKLRGEEAQKTARERAVNAFNSKIKYPGEAIMNAYPDQAARAKMVDADGIPVDPHGIYAPIAGDKMSFDKNEDGSPVLMAKRVGTDSAREGSYGQIGIDPKTQELVEIPIHRQTGTPEPPKQTSPILDGGKGQAEKETKKQVMATNGPKASLMPLTGKASQGGASDKPKNGVRVIGKYVRPQQFNPLLKSATATDEARNSLIGDDPDKTGGLMADLDVFKDPKSQERIMQYLGFIEKNLSAEGGKAAGAGPAAAVEWYAGLPTAVSNLQQQAQNELALSLSPAEQRFVSDYFRTMGTIGGMRAATGAPASQWAFQVLYNELPTPGKVTNINDAKRRITNLVQETNVVAKRNPLSSLVDVNKLDKPDTPALPAHWQEELDKDKKKKK